MSKIELEFEGIDDWNRPIFKDKLNNRYGSVNLLCSWEDKFEDVIKVVTEFDITYFGRQFGCEPMGTSIDANKIKLVKNFTKD